VTSGGESGTNGKAGFRPGPWTAIALLTIPVVLVNATSALIEMQRAGLRVHPAEPFIWEITSASVLVLMAPLVGMAVKRWPLLPGPGLMISLVIHAALTVPFSLAHVAVMLPIRHLAYALAFNWPYEFFGGGTWITLIYEWRKDLLTYAIFAAIYTFYAWLQAREAAAQSPTAAAAERIEVREGGRTVFLMPADILYLEAAGNYVTLHTAGSSHLVRGTLTDWDHRLSGGGQASPPLPFVRIHRSRIVNRAHISAIRGTPSGDFEVTLTSGKSLTGSRRFRAGLS